MVVALLAGASGAFGVAGCVGGKKGPSAEDKEKLKPYIVDVAPADAKPVDVNFENKMHIVGFKTDPEIAKPNTEVKITYVWRCDAALDDGWLLYTHVLDEVSSHQDNLDWNGPLREKREDGTQILPPSKWEKGKFYLDEQTYKVPEWVTGPELVFTIGIWKGDARLRILTGANDGDNGATFRVKTGLTPPPKPEPQHTEIPEVTLNKLAANDVIKIDGKADDKAWGGASLLPFVDVGTGAPSTAFPASGTAKLSYDDKNLYVLFEVKEPDVVGGWDDKKKKDDEWTVKGQPKLWTKDTVEIMIDPDGDGDNKDYYELQISPQNRQFHTTYDAERVPLTDPNGPFGHEEWDPKMKSAVVVTGTLDKADDKDEGYVVEAAIPWTAFAKAANHPPKLGDAWRVNLYIMKQNNGVAWSPILEQGSFHHAARFGRVKFGPLPAIGAAAASGSAANGPTPGVAPSAATAAPTASGSARPSGPQGANVGATAAPVPHTP
ncbi:hypothetical protein BH09MYX1_BH09MYX1_57460 [soil metagenome]